MRLLDVNFGLMLDRSSTSAEGRWKRVLAALGNPAEVEWNGDFYSIVSCAYLRTRQSCLDYGVHRFRA